MRFTDDGTSIWQFVDEILVKCPQCEGRAVVRKQDPELADFFAPRRVSCGGCGFSQDIVKRGIIHTWTAVDDFFGFPLWLQAPCCGHVLWAYNLQHLQFLQDFVQAKIRERRIPGLVRSGRVNSTLASRFPRWIKDAGNREQILKAIERIRRLT